MNMIKCALQIFKFSKGAAQRGRTEGALLPVRPSAPEHNPYMTSKQHSTTARWIRLGVNFEEGGNLECPEKTLEVRLRSTETQSTYNICSRGGRCD